MYFACPETRNHSLEEVDLIFMSRSSKLKDSAAAKTLLQESLTTTTSILSSDDGSSGSQDGGEKDYLKLQENIVSANKRG